VPFITYGAKAETDLDIQEKTRNIKYYAQEELEIYITAISCGTNFFRSLLFTYVFPWKYVPTKYALKN
jgi:hypothetical protein